MYSRSHAHIDMRMRYPEVDMRARTRTHEHIKYALRILRTDSASPFHCGEGIKGRTETSASHGPTRERYCYDTDSYSKIWKQRRHSHNPV